METNLKFKIGDKVRVKSLEWYNQGFTIIEDFSFTEEMSLLCGKIVTIDEIREKCYLVKESDYYWQDWMLEDEPVAEEKQEVEQLNQSDMETKEMTLREAQEFLNNKKIMCLSEEETTKVQTKLFKLGIYWEDETEETAKVDTSTFLIFVDNKEILQTNTIKDWIEDEAEKIEVSEILSIKIKEDEKPRFDPNTLQPFDRVLVRQGKHVEWSARFFDFCEDDNYYTTSGSAWVMCVPYNEETKHLHKTTEEAPEFYKIWE